MPPSPPRITVWQLPLDAPAESGSQDGILSLLTDADRARAARLVRAQDRRRWAMARLGLRRILAAETGRPADTLGIVTGPTGKPYLVGGGPHFNLSHSGGLALVALCQDAPVGIDLEQPGRARDLDGMARLVMTGEELDSFGRLPQSDQPSAFLRLWTRKEAAVKADGRGLSIDPRTLSVGMDPARVRRVQIGGVEYVVHDLALSWPASLASPLEAEPVLRLWPAGG